MKDTLFYNAESAMYSEKRYPKKPVTFTQYFFIKRLEITLQLIASLRITKPRALLEIGPADGVVIRKVWESFPNAFSFLHAVDASPGMIKVAKKSHADTPIQFSVRSQLSPGTYDLVLETGVVNYLDYEKEFAEVSTTLTPGGYYIVSVAGNSSLQNRVKGSKGYANLLPYAAYEREMHKYFTIERTVPVGFFLPLLWRMPAIARVVQPVFDLVLYPFTNLALEKVYVAKKK